MGRIKIGIFDKERLYVERLSVYLDQFGDGLWSVVGFTDEGLLKKYLVDKRISLLMGTDRRYVEQLNELFPDICYVWLADNKTGGKGQDRRSLGIYSVYRYQSAKAVGQAIKDIVVYMGIIKSTSKKSVVIYSPVGRCGKTSMARKYIKEGQIGNWLYVGMEDYSYLDEEDKYSAEDFLYYVKDRNEQAVCDILERNSGIIPSPFSPFDTRLIDRNDVEWFLDIFEKQSFYRGVIFDIGTGVMQNLNVLLAFDHVVVPYIDNDLSMEKRKQFEELIRAYELNELLDKIHYLNMDKGDHLTEFSHLLQ